MVIPFVTHERSRSRNPLQRRAKENVSLRHRVAGYPGKGVWDFSPTLWLGYANRPASHKTSMDEEDQSGGVEFKSSALCVHSKRHILQNPSLLHPVGHDSIHSQRCRDRCSLKVFALAAGVLGESRRRNVESSKSCQAAKNEKGQNDGVDERSKTEGKSYHGGRYAKRDLPDSLLADRRKQS